MIPNRFSNEAMQIIKDCKAYANEFCQEFISSEHFLLALTKQDNEFIKQYHFDFNFEILYSILNDIFGNQKINEKEDKASINKYIFTPEGDMILKRSRDIQKRYRNSVITVDFMWIALLSDENSLANYILRMLEVNIDFLIGEFYKRLEFKIDSDKSDSEDVDTFALEKYTVDITKKARENKLDKIIGRRNEINRIIQVLGRRSKNNVILVGEPGVGKTAIVEGLAQEISSSVVPGFLKEKKILSLDLGSMVAGSKYRGEFEDRLKKLINEVRNDGNILLFIDEIHTLIGAGSAEGTLDAANILKPALARGDVQCIGATTIDEYRKYFEKDKALERRFEQIKINEPSTQESVEILSGLKYAYEQHHGVVISENAIVTAVNLSERYIQHRCLPDKAINIIDETSSRLRINNEPITEEHIRLAKEVIQLEYKKQQAVNNNDFEMAASIRDKIIELKNNFKLVNRSKSKNKIIVEASDIEKTISNLTGINIEKISKGESYKLANLESLIHKRIKGQNDAVKAICRTIRRSRAGLNDPNRPLGSFMFLGPTGVGKTEICRVLSEILFDRSESFIKIDMSEYMEKHSVSKLIGSPPGYVGYDEGGQLTNKVRNNPYCLVLFDEIEKAHSDVFNILLQVLEDGELNDSEGRKINFRNTIIIMTSNAGAHDIANTKNLGFGAAGNIASDYAVMKQNVMNSVKELFRPEFINRIDELIIFHELNKNEIKDIIKLLLKECTSRLSERNIILKWTPAVENFILENGYSRKFGARPLKRFIQSNIIDVISEAIIKGIAKENSTIRINVKNKKLDFIYN